MFGIGKYNGFSSPLSYGFPDGKREFERFIAATEISDTNIKFAIATLIYDLKSAGIWYKREAIYPFVGGTASTHKFNLKNPEDSNNAYRLSFSGGWTHASTGAKPNGSNGYADSFWIPANTLPEKNSCGMTLYSRTQTGNNNGLHGMTNTTSSALCFCPRYSGMIFGATNDLTGQSVANSDARGFFQMHRTKGFGTFGAVPPGDTPIVDIYKNTTRTRSTVDSLGNSDGYSFCWGARKTNFAGITNYSDLEISYGCFGVGLTPYEAQVYYTIVQKYQTILGRNV